MASYSASLLEAGKSKVMACSIISPIEALCCSPRQAPICRKAPSTSQIRLVLFLIEEFMLKIQLVLASLTPSEVYNEYRTHSVQLPIKPFVLTGWAYV